MHLPRRGGNPALLAVLLAALLSLVLAQAAQAALVVNDDSSGVGPPEANCSAPDFATIQAAVEAAPAGSKVLVCAGTYAGATINKELTLQGPQVGLDARERNTPPSEEAIVSAPSGAIFELSATRDVIDGFRLESAGDATGIQLGQGNSEALIEDNVFSAFAGKAVAGIFEKPTLRHNVVSGSAVGFESNTRAAVGASVDANGFTGTSVYDVAFLKGGTGIVITRNGRSDGGGVFAYLLGASQAQVSDNGVADIEAPAIYLGGGDYGTTIQRNSLTGIDGTSEGAIAIADELGFGANRRATIVGNILSGNLRGITFAESSAGSVFDVHFNRIVGNEIDGLVNFEGSFAAVDATNNWWGCNAGPGSPGCDTVEGAAVYDPWLVLSVSASPTTIYRDTGLTRLLGEVSRNSDGVVAGSSFPNNVGIVFGTDLGSITPPSEVTLGGRASSTLAAGGTLGTAHVTAKLDNQTVTTQVKIVEAPEGAPGSNGSAGEPGKSGSSNGGTLALKRKMSAAFVRPVASVSGGKLIVVLRCSGTIAQRCVGKVKVRIDGSFHKGIYSIASGRKARVKIPGPVPTQEVGVVQRVRAVAVTAQVSGRPIKTARKLKLRWPAP
jgi:hypothetical protein